VIKQSDKKDSLHVDQARRIRKSICFMHAILLIEDDYFLAFDLRNELVRRGAEVIGPFGSSISRGISPNQCGRWTPRSWIST
jgi:hypothetical protein